MHTTLRSTDLLDRNAVHALCLAGWSQQALQSNTSPLSPFKLSEVRSVSWLYPLLLGLHPDACSFVPLCYPAFLAWGRASHSTDKWIPLAMPQWLEGTAFTPAVLTMSSAFHLIYIPSVDFLRGRRPRDIHSIMGKGEMGARERRDMQGMVGRKGKGEGAREVKKRRCWSVSWRISIKL